MKSLPLITQTINQSLVICNPLPSFTMSYVRVSTTAEYFMEAELSSTEAHTATLQSHTVHLNQSHALHFFYSAHTTDVIFRTDLVNMDNGTWRQCGGDLQLGKHQLLRYQPGCADVPAGQWRVLFTVYQAIAHGYKVYGRLANVTMLPGTCPTPSHGPY